jgi:hypothetical protein
MTARTSGWRATVTDAIDLRQADRVGDVLLANEDALAFERDLGCLGEAAKRGAVVEGNPLLERQPRQRAVHGAGVEVAEAEARGEAARDRALARARGAVYRHDHPLLLPAT